MAQSFKKRFAGKEDEIRQTVREKGWLPAMGDYSVSTTGAWQNYIESIMQGEKFPMVAEAYTRDYDDVFKQLGYQVLNRLFALEKEHERLLQEKQFQRLLDTDDNNKTKSMALGLVRVIG